MPGKVEVGLKYYQELAKGIDEGRAEVVSLDDVIDTPAGKFQQVLKTEETTALESGEKEYKFYAPGIGQIQDDMLKLVKYELPNTSQARFKIVGRNLTSLLPHLTSSSR